MWLNINNSLESMSPGKIIVNFHTSHNLPTCEKKGRKHSSEILIVACPAPLMPKNFKGHSNFPICASQGHKVSHEKLYISQNQPILKISKFLMFDYLPGNKNVFSTYSISSSSLIFTVTCQFRISNRRVVRVGQYIQLILKLNFILSF